MPTWLVWFTVVQSVLMALVGMFLYSIRLSFRGGSLEHRLVVVERRMDQAGAKMSDIASDVQNLPDRIREECASKRELDIVVVEFRRDRDEFRQHMNSAWRKSPR